MSSSKEFNRRRFLRLATAAAAGAMLPWPALAGMAEEVKNKGDLPVVVVGAGLGSLTAAAYLARAGFPVTVVESHEIPGGYATSFSRDGGRFEFEVALHQTAITEPKIKATLSELGVYDRLEPVPVPELSRIITPDLDLTLPNHDPQGVIRVLSQAFPGSAQGIAEYIQRICEAGRHLGELPDQMGLWSMMTFPLRHGILWDLRKLTLSQMIAESVKDPKAAAMLGFQWGYYGLPPDQLSAFFATAGTSGYLNHGGYYLKPRSGALAQALADAITAAGGQVIYQRRVEAIDLAQGKVAGVRLDGGEKLPARLVFCGGNAPDLFNKMLPAGSLPDDYAKKVRTYRNSLGTFIVWLGLETEVRGKVEGYGITLRRGYDPQADYQATLAGDMAGAPVTATFYDNLFPGYSKPGTSTVMIMSLAGMEPWQKLAPDYWAGKKDAYNRQKEAMAQAMIQRIEEKVYPGLSKHIGVMVTASPLTNQRYTHNPGGAIYGYEQVPANSFINRIPNQTPIPGLYLSSAWGNPGGGYAGAIHGGRGAFQQMIEDLT